ncbi:MAG: hypothetical protein KDD66_03815 [Bdellovibrionales bacterium]|nr:hypothetical protein [Bdellovibrionales bacterium]
MRSPLVKFRAQSGATTAEYSLIVALLNVALITVLVGMRMSIGAEYEAVALALGGGSSSSLDGSEASR